MDEDFQEARTNKNFEKFVYAHNQNNEELINPDFICRVNEKGDLIPLSEKIDVKQEIVMYWQNRLNLIGFVIFICSAILLFMLLNESQILNQVWQQALQLFNSINLLGSSGFFGS